MPVTPLNPGYAFPSLDGEEKFHGNRLVYFHWEEHLNFCAALCFPLPPAMPFGAAVEQVLGPVYGDDPDWEKIDWAAARWTLDGAPFTPDFSRSLDEQGVRHKSLLRFWTKPQVG